MTRDELQAIAPTAIALELKPDVRYLIFVKSDGDADRVLAAAQGAIKRGEPICLGGTAVVIVREYPHIYSLAEPPPG